MNWTHLERFPFKRWSIAAIASVALAGTPAFAQTTEDEWYDPTDWFDGNNVESDDTFDYEAYDYDYDYGFDGTYDYASDWDTYDTWGDDYWDADYYDAAYWDDYDWYADTDTIEEAYDDDTYDYSIYADNQSNQRTSGDNAKKQKQQVATLSGTIEGLRKMRLERGSGATGTYTIAKVKLDSGQSTVVNLGREWQLSDVDLKKGDKIKALGRRGMVAGENVFVAHKLKADNETINANPVIRLASQGQQNQTTFAGKVSKIMDPQANADASEHTLVQLKLENGQTRVVDLGPNASVQKIKLNEGDQITVKGQLQQVKGQQVLMPNLLKVEGQNMTAAVE